MSITPNHYMSTYYLIVKQLVEEIRLATDITKMEKYEDHAYLIKRIQSTLFEGPQVYNSFELSEIIFYVLNNKYLNSYNTPRSQISAINGCTYSNYISRPGYKMISYLNRGLCFLIITEKHIYNLTGLGFYNTSINTIRNIINFMYHYIKDRV